MPLVTIHQYSRTSARTPARSLNSALVACPELATSVTLEDADKVYLMPID
jgi:hypothetical protein